MLCELAAVHRLIFPVFISDRVSVVLLDSRAPKDLILVTMRIEAKIISKRPSTANGKY